MMDIDVEEQPHDAVSSEGILPKLVEAGSSLDQVEAAKQGRGIAKSGRWWKTIRKQRSSGIVKVKPLKSSWKQKMKQKANFTQVKKLVDEIRQKQAAEKAAKLEAKQERERRREENARRAEIVQVIKNTHKLKRAKRKQLRRIEKRDTN
uniref:Coiled-coil domain-containing protein 86 n=1 Tax=Parascaris univalens TaxID=6257 RepID=A0A915AWV5_PARUN